MKRTGRSPILRALLILVVGAGLVPCSFATEKLPPLPKELPPYGPLVPFQAPQTEVRKLPNGLTLWLVPRPGFPKVSFVLAVHGGMAADPKDRPGLSELLVGAIDQGTKAHSAREIAEEFEAAGGDLTGGSHADSIVLSVGVLASRLDTGLAALADVAENATFPASEVALAKRNAIDNLRAQEAEPGFLANRELAKAVFGDHPYSVVSPTQSSLEAATAAQLRQEYARRFRPDQALLVAVGDFEVASLVAEIERDFGKWAAPASAPVPPVEPPPHENAHAVYLVPRPGSVQTDFRVASFGPTERDPDYAAAQVANAIYGGMFGSRLIRNIREDKGYTYSPGASLVERGQAGLLQTTANVRNAVTGAAFNEVDYELNRMATTEPSAEEVTAAERYLVGLNAIILQLEGAVASRLATLWAYGLPPDEIGKQSERIQKVTPAEAEAAGAKYFPASRQTIVTVGEEKLIEDQLAPFHLTIHKPESGHPHEQTPSSR